MKKRTYAQKWAAYLSGVAAEYIALLFLSVKGYRFVARRFRSPFGEIDLIFCKKHFYIFVEVKYRKTFHNALESLSYHQQQRISKSAAFFMAKRPSTKAFHARFDLVALNRYFLPKHLKNVMIEGVA